MKFQGKVVCAVLICAIVAVNIITAVNIFAKTNNKEDLSFGKPTYIMIYKDGKSIKTDKNDKLYNSIIKLNEKRDDYVDGYTQTADLHDKEKDIYIEYVFEKAYDVKLKLTNNFRDEYTNYSVDKIGFVLTGEHNGIVNLYTGETCVSVEKLNANAELINLIKKQ